MTNQNKKQLYKIIAAAVLFILGGILPVGNAAKFGLFAASFLVSGLEVVVNAVRNIFGGQVFDEEFLMTVATIGAFCIGEYPEGAAVMLLFQVGELFQSYAVNKSRKSISDLMDIRPDFANVLTADGCVKKDPYDVNIGDRIVINPGERVPLDSVILRGQSSLDTSALTGESMPRDVAEGDEVLSGCINISGALTAAVKKPYGESTVNRILDLVENASNKKSKSEKFITKFARWYTPAVCGVALVLAVVPSLITGEWGVWVYRALSFLVVSCPCALVISVPLSFFGGLGGASRRGVLVKGSNYLETMAQVKAVVFDKTGTLTTGKFEVTQVNAVDKDEDKLLYTAALCESFSSHPIAQCIKNAVRDIDSSAVSEAKELAGFGVTCNINGVKTIAGNEKLMRQNGIEFDRTDAFGSVVHVAQAGRYLGSITVSDVIKPNAKQLIAGLKAMGVEKTVMLTGDVKATGEKIAAELGIDTAITQLLPDQKVMQLEKVMETVNGKVCYVGDGINDAPVLARADVGVAMGAMGSDAAIEAADIVIMDDDIDKITTAVKVAQKTLTIVKQNIVFAIGVKLLVLLLVAAGWATMWLAVFADVGVAVIAILNAVRALNTKGM